MPEVLTGPGFGAFHFSHESTLIPNGPGTLSFTYGRLGHRASQRHVHSTELTAHVTYNGFAPTALSPLPDDRRRAPAAFLASSVSSAVTP